MRLARLLPVVCVLLAAAPARGGGFDLPDHGTEALGRGGAFAAKADDGTALYYNIAGLARQRGTRVTLDTHLVVHDDAFAAAGVYPGDPGRDGAWAGRPYPTIHDDAHVFPLPILGISTDFGFFRRWTFGFGIYGPPSIGARSYGLTGSTSPVATVKLADGTVAPAPSRYDITRTSLIIVYPTLGAAVSATKWLDVGVAAQLVYANFDLATANVTPLPSCFGLGDPRCDAYADVKTTGWTWAAMMSLMFRPTPWMDIGLSYRPQIDVHTTGTLHATPPPALPQTIDDAKVTFNTTLPHILRLGVRYVNRYADGSERADVELDGEYENWGAPTDRWGRQFNDDNYPPSAGDPYNDGAKSYQPDLIHAKDFALGPRGQLTANLDHAYHDTFSIRLGGAYNFRLDDRSRLIARLGFYYDSAATTPEHTRLDFDTQDKFAVTTGLGYRWRGLTVNAAYAFVYSPPRDVTSSQVTAVDALRGTEYPTTNYTPLVVGNGRFAPSTHIVSLGISVDFPAFRRPPPTAH